MNLEKMCDHNDVSQLKINNLQISDGNTRYTCINCNEVIKSNDVEFNKKYKRLYNPCNTHTFQYEEMSNIKDSNGNVHCLWCGMLFNEQ